MKNAQKIFEAYVIKKEGRYTIQKQSILDHISKIKRHFEVEELIDLLRQNKMRFSRATVYRTIKQLLEAGLIQKITTREGRVFYEMTSKKKQHDHVICNSCGKIQEIKEDIIEKYLEEFCQKLGFHPEYRSLHIYGQCKRCYEGSL